MRRFPDDIHDSSPDSLTRMYKYTPHTSYRTYDTRSLRVGK